LDIFINEEIKSEIKQFNLIGPKVDIVSSRHCSIPTRAILTVFMNEKKEVKLETCF